MKQLYSRLLASIQLWARKRSYRIAKSQADKEHAATGRKVFVVLYKGEFIALTKKRLKLMRKASIIHNQTLKHIENIAVYTAK